MPGVKDFFTHPRDFHAFWFPILIWEIGGIRFFSRLNEKKTAEKAEGCLWEKAIQRTF
jgi:hypothetical protein